MAKDANSRRNPRPNSQPISRSGPVSDERDQTQRSLGCVSLSAIVHGGLLVAIVLAPSFRTQIGDVSGKETALEFVGEPSAPAAAVKSVTPPSPQAKLPKAIAPPKSEVADALETARAQASKTKTKTSEAGPKQLETVDSSEVALPAKIEKVQSQSSAPSIAASDTSDENSSSPLDQKVNDDEDDEDSNSSNQGSAVVKNESAVAPPVARSEAPPEAAKINQPSQTNESAQTSEPATDPATGPGAATGATPESAKVAATGTTAANSRGGGAGYAVPLGISVRDARTLIAMPGNPKPTYPLADQIAGRQGTAVLVAKVKNDGSVENVTLERSSGSPLMDESAAKAFKSWKYRPGQAGFVRLPVQFQLAGEAKTIPAQLKRR